MRARIARVGSVVGLVQKRQLPLLARDARGREANEMTE
jgi:hypothetical protein